MARETRDILDADVVVSDDLASLRSYELDALSSILPPDRRDRMAEILTDEDVATLKHLAKEGMGRSTLRALASDLNYLETWAAAALGRPLPWPAPEALVLKFVAHHLFDPAEREKDRAHGMPLDVEAMLRSDGCLRCMGPHAPATVRRRLAIWSVLHKWRGVEGPFASGNVRAAIRLAVRASDRPRSRKSRDAVTRDVLDRLLDTCAGGSIVDYRDKALLLVAFASGGRRRSEVARLRLEDLVDRPDVEAGGATADGTHTGTPALPGAASGPHQDGRRRPGRKSASDRATRHGAADVDLTGANHERRDLSTDRPVRSRGTGRARWSERERDPQKALRQRRARSRTFLRPRIALRLSD